MIVQYLLSICISEDKGRVEWSFEPCAKIYDVECWHAHTLERNAGEKDARVCVFLYLRTHV